MSIAEAFSLALKNIRTSKMRTFLTMLGIIIGVMAVIVIVGLGNGLSNYVTESFSSMGTNTLTVSINGRGSSTRNVNADQMYDIVSENSDYLEYISPTVNVMGTAKVSGETLSYTSTTGVSEDYLEIKNYALSAGRNITYGDVAERKGLPGGSLCGTDIFWRQRPGRDPACGGYPA